MCASDMTNAMGDGIDALLLAARFLDERENTISTPPPPPPPPPPPTIPIPSPALLRPLVLHHVPLQTVTIHAAPTVTSSPIKKPPSPPSCNRLTVMNSFDIINPPLLDHGSGEVKRKQPPMAFRTGTREVHNKLEKNRRAQLKECFDQLYAQLPDSKENKKTSNLSILESAKRCIGALEGEQRHHELQMEMLAREKIALQTRVTNLKRDIFTLYNVEVNVPDENDDEAKCPPPPVTNGVICSKVLELLEPGAVLVKQPTTIAAIACASNVLRPLPPKSINGTMPCTVLPSTANGVKPELAAAATTTAATFTIPGNLQMVQKIMMTSTTPTHFIAASSAALVVVSTPSRSS